MNEKKVVKASRSFSEKVYEIVEKIPEGKVATYGQIAMEIGSPFASRAVGSALRKTPGQRKIPCHRVVNQRGELAPGDAFGGEEHQRLLLKSEGIPFKKNGLIDLSKCICKF